MQVNEIMSSKVVTVGMDDTLKVVKALFENLPFHHLLVVEDGKLIGVISDRDLLKAISPNIGTNIESYKDVATLNKKVHQIMSRNPVTLPPDASVIDAITAFNSHSISCLPIVDGSAKVVGIVSWRDMLKSMQAMLLSGQSLT